MTKEVLGVQISTDKEQEIKDKIKKLINSDSTHNYIFTPNAEMLVDAYQDEYFQTVLNSAKINICDSKGVNFFSFHTFERITGVDFMKELCEIAQEEQLSLYLLGSESEEVIDKLEQKLKDKYPNLTICGSHPGPEIEIISEAGINKLGVDKDDNNKIIHEIIMKSPDIVFVAFGHLKQELWIYNFLSDIPKIKLAMGVGGAFDYISESKTRAPEWMRKIGFEWLYRVYKEPWRIKRIFKAVFIFPLLIGYNKVKKSFKKII